MSVYDISIMATRKFYLPMFGGTFDNLKKSCTCSVRESKKSNFSIFIKGLS